jgi:hypothetical protein
MLDDAKPMAKDDEYRDWVNQFEEAETASDDSRQISNRCRDYYDNKQHTSEDKAILIKRKQPPLVFNRVKRKVNFLTGYEIQQRTDPKAFPRNYPFDEESANAATEALRYVQEAERIPEKFSDSFEAGIIEGFGGVEVLYNPKSSCPKVTSVAWDRLYFDPYSSKHDFSDATYCGIVVWMDESRAMRLYPDKKKELENTFLNESRLSSNSTSDDKPRHNKWVSTTKRKRLRICQHYYLKDDKWHWAHFTQGGLLKGGEPVPYLDNQSEPECPLVMWSCYVDRENNRYGEVLELLDIQDEINKRRSKLLYQLSVRQVKYTKGAFDNPEKIRQELARPDGLIAVNPGKDFDILENTDQTSGQFQLLQEAKMEMEFAGPNSNLMGDTKAGASGRAIIASQQGGLSELGRVTSRFRDFKRRVYMQCWNRIRQFWREEKWLRITDSEKNVITTGLNIPETVGDVMLMQAEQSGLPPDQLEQLKQQIEADPNSKQPTGRLKNNVGEMDVDIILDETVDTVTLQQEQFSELAELAKGGFPIPPSAVIKASSLRNKQEILDDMKNQQAPQAPPEIQDAQQRMMAAEVKDKEAKANQAEVKAQSDAFDFGVKTVHGGKDPDANTDAQRIGNGAANQ